jgi:hypothetical protein
VATIVIARWEGALDAERMAAVLRGETAPDADAPETALADRVVAKDASLPL